MKKLPTLIAAMAIMFAVAYITPQAEASEPVETVQYFSDLENPYRELSPKGCYYFSSNKNLVFEKRGFYTGTETMCGRFQIPSILYSWVPHTDLYYEIIATFKTINY